MSRDFVYSDPHFGHAKVLEFESRPFISVEDMTKQLIKNWNKVVKKSDTVYVLGDVSFKLTKEEVKTIITSLNGKKVLILGNHDRSKTVTWWKDVGFDTVHKYPICYEWRFWLSHEPMTMHEDLPYINIHGHLHGLTISKPQYINVSVEQINYAPLLLTDITDLYPREGKGTKYMEETEEIKSNQ